MLFEYSSALMIFVSQATLRSIARFAPAGLLNPRMIDSICFSSDPLSTLTLLRLLAKLGFSRTISLILSLLPSRLISSFGNPKAIISKVVSLTLTAAPKVAAIAPPVYYALFASVLLKVSANAPLGSFRAAWIKSPSPGWLLISLTTSAAVLVPVVGSSGGYVITISRVFLWVGIYCCPACGATTWAHDASLGPVSFVTADVSSLSSCWICLSSGAAFSARSLPSIRSLILYHATCSSRLRFSRLSASLTIVRGFLLPFPILSAWLGGAVPPDA
jgi:hypothetical protein